MSYNTRDNMPHDHDGMEMPGLEPVQPDVKHPEQSPEIKGVINDEALRELEQSELQTELEEKKKRGYLDS